MWEPHNPIQWILGAVFPRVKRPGSEGGHPSFSVSTSRISGAVPPHPSVPSWRGQKENYFSFNIITYNPWPGAKGGLRCGGRGVRMS